MFPRVPRDRLEREPCLVTRSPLVDGWLLRLAFDGEIPRYLRRSSAVQRFEVEPLLADFVGLTRFLEEKLIGSELEELTFANLRSMERSFIHRAAQELGLFSCSQGTGLGRQLLVRRTPQEDTDALEVPVEAPEPPVVQRSEGPRSRKRRGVHLVEKSMPF
ncbi:unnamed protein product [Durusdinium trenchii]|uniref:R3H domain-containing protein n=1 Tax=Durusdinium trenchii TaxID=1381693 RepID=A0ABP0Q084_9DINO